MEIQSWKAQVEKELKGKSIENLIQQIEDGVFTQPLLNEVKITSGVSFRAKHSWSIQQSFKTKLPELWNALALEALQGGVNKLVIPQGWNSSDLLIALQNIWVAYVEFVLTAENYSDYHNVLVQLAAVQAKGDLQPTHKYIISSESAYQLAASHAEQLAHLMLMGIEQIERTTESLDHELAHIQFEVHVSNQILVEIAKIRALRKLWSHVLSNSSLEHTCSNHCYISAITDRNFQATTDSDNNLIRSTIQACAAVLGGANTVEVSPMESFSNEDHSNHLRWARNIQHLLAEESYLNQYSDAAMGSFSIEDLTNQLVQQAWKIMKEFQVAQALMNHMKNMADQRIQTKNKQVVVGQNKYVRS
jgi:methylmalonyl-CoA mutase N-terminal domain/subunit